MDRSFLSQTEVIAASRKFVCIRPLSYESKEEADYLKKLCPTRSGELENTVVCLLSPDASQKLGYAGRSTRQLFGTAANMASAMNGIAVRYDKPENGASGRSTIPSRVPEVAGVRLALDVASSDNQPLVIAFGRDAANLKALRTLLAGAAWSDQFVGRLVYTSTLQAKDLEAIEGIGAKPGVLVVQPDRFGLKGTELARADADATPDALEETLRKGLAAHQRIGKSFGEHVRDGHSQGIFWETAIPVTDPQEAQARERGRQSRHNR